MQKNACTRHFKTIKRDIISIQLCMDELQSDQLFSKIKRKFSWIQANICIECSEAIESVAQRLCELHMQKQNEIKNRGEAKQSKETTASIIQKWKPMPMPMRRIS